MRKPNVKSKAMPSLKMGGEHSLHESVEKIENGFVRTRTHSRYNPDGKDGERYQSETTKTFHRVHPGLHASLKKMAMSMGKSKGKGGSVRAMPY